MSRFAFHRDVPDLCPHIHMPCLSRGARPSNRLWRCYAKVVVNDEEQKPRSSSKAFSIKVPNIPMIRDREAARRLLESAFQAMPKLPIDSALQGISRLPIAKRVLIFDITGFVATKLGRPQKGHVDIAPDDGQYPRCAWPRVSTAALSHDSSSDTMPTPNDLHQFGSGSSLVTEQRPTMYPHSKWPRAAVRSKKPGYGNEAVLDERIGVNVSLASSSSVVSSKAAVVGVDLLSDAPSNAEFGWTKEDFPLVIDQGGPRCAWPRKTISAKQSGYVETPVGAPQKLQMDVSGAEKGGASSLRLLDDNDGATALPRRMLATSVGLTVMNQLARRGFFMAASVMDYCSLLPAGPLELTE